MPLYGKQVKLYTVAPPAGAWIETDIALLFISSKFVAPPAGAWIETLLTEDTKGNSKGRPPRGGVD